MRIKLKVALLAFALAVSFNLTAFAGDVMNEMIGLVVSNEDGELNVVEDGTDLEWMCLTTEAEAYDLLTGLPVYAEDIEAGTYIRVFDEPRGPILWVNCWEDGAAAFKAMVSENIQYDEDTCYFLTGDEKYRVTLTPDTVIYDPDIGFIGPEDIRPGNEMFVWVDMVTASCPAQAYPDQVVIIK